MNTNCGEELVLAAAALAIQLSKGLTVEQTETLAVFFTSLANNLALIANQCQDKQ